MRISRFWYHNGIKNDEETKYSRLRCRDSRSFPESGIINIDYK